jgi:transposase
LVDALGNPIGFFLTGGEAHDLVGADHLPSTIQADILIADKAYDADQRVLEPLAAASKSVVIPAKANRREPRVLDRDMYGARHLIENFLRAPKAATQGCCAGSARSASWCWTTGCWPSSPPISGVI